MFKMEMYSGTKATKMGQSAHHLGSFKCTVFRQYVLFGFFTSRLAGAGCTRHVLLGRPEKKRVSFAVFSLSLALGA